MARELEVVTDVRAVLGEGPSWDADKKNLYWVDIIEKKLFILDTVSGAVNEFSTDKYIGCAVPKKNGGIALALQDGFYSLDHKTGQFERLAQPENYNSFMYRFNDGKCDKNGRFWAGTTSFYEESNEAQLYCLEENLKVNSMLENVTVSNGLGWSPDNTTMYYIDSPKREVYAFDYDLKTGSIMNQRTVIDFHSQQANPDGMAVDAEGMLWIAHWGGYQVSRWDPATGSKIDSIPVPVARVTSCVFGGEQLDELYITTAKLGVEEKQLQEEPLSGALFKVKLETKGLPTYHFAG